jgi:hypothetical protein
MQEDRSLLVSLKSINEAEIEQYGPLPEGHKRRRRGRVGQGSCFRLEPLPPMKGACHTPTVACVL